MEFKSNFDVDLIQYAGSDTFICQAARVSTKGAESLGTDESEGLIKFLMKNRHGTPFEHAMFTFRINAPIFVWREFMRHRIGFSYNEQSGRYMKMSPVFYIPATSRDLVQTGKTGEYNFEPGNVEQYALVRKSLQDSYDKAWDAYMSMLAAGVAKEVARMSLPTSLYSAAYVTCNPRSLMAFLSLRTKSDRATYPSFPMWEISEVARLMESYFQDLFPLTHNAFDEFGRVCP